MRVYLVSLAIAIIISTTSKALPMVAASEAKAGTEHMVAHHSQSSYPDGIQKRSIIDVRQGWAIGWMASPKGRRFRTKLLESAEKIRTLKKQLEQDLAAKKALVDELSKETLADDVDEESLRSEISILERKINQQNQELGGLYASHSGLQVEHRNVVGLLPEGLWAKTQLLMRTKPRELQPEPM
jgi:polyhydroxyalkanoate synthesis regulator phasin